MRGGLGGDGAGDYAGLGGGLKRGESKHRREGQHIVPSFPMAGT